MNILSPDLSTRFPYRHAAFAGAALGFLLFCADPAHAAGSGMPWEAPLTAILESIEGPVARIIAVIIIVITGLSLAFGETSGGFRRLIQIVFGLSIAFAATSFFPQLLLLRRRSAHRMTVEGFEIPLHRALTEPILMGGAPRTVAIVNGTLAAALGLGLQLWVAGVVVWIVGHTAAVYAARKDPAFMEVLVRHVRHKGHLSC